MYKTEDLERQSIEAIDKYKLCFIEEVVSFLPCDKTTFYNHKLHESNAIKEKIESNKTTLKVGLRKKWYDSENATVQMALYKLISSDEERKNLSMNYTELTGANGKDLIPVIRIGYGSTDD